MSTEQQNNLLTPTPLPLRQSTSALLTGDQLKQAVNRLAAETMRKLMTDQNGVPTFCDSHLLDFIRRLNELDKKLPWEESIAQLGCEAGIMADALRRLQLCLWRRSQGRLVDFQDRFSLTGELRSESDIGFIEAAMSQGSFDCMRWKDKPLFKTAFDFSLYTMMLSVLKPKTIIELGSGVGASAIWLADLLKLFEIGGHVYSADLKKPALEYQGVTFIQGDCMRIERVFDENFMKSAPHPWMLIEDAHVNVYGVLSHFHPYVREGEYVIVEDSMNFGELEAILRFMNEYRDHYKVDTYYTDFFGRNATCAQDSIFMRV